MDASHRGFGPARGVNRPRLVRLIAAGGGVGFARYAPGTVASAAAAFVGAGLLKFPPVALIAAAVAASLGGFWAVRAARVDGDPGWVVADEIAGQLIALMGLRHPSGIGLLAAFVLFRLLDIVKPGPVGWADRQTGPFGIMADDIIAGLIAAGLLLGLRTAWPSALG